MNLTTRAEPLGKGAQAGAGAKPLPDLYNKIGERVAINTSLKFNNIAAI